MLAFWIAQHQCIDPPSATGATKSQEEMQEVSFNPPTFVQPSFLAFKLTLLLIPMLLCYLFPLFPLSAAQRCHQWLCALPERRATVTELLWVRF